MYTKILSNVTSIFYTNRHPWRPAIEQLIESLDLAATNDPLTSLNAIFMQNRENPWTATSRDFEAWLRTTHGLEPEALPEPTVVQPEVTVAQPEPAVTNVPEVQSVDVTTVPTQSLFTSVTSKLSSLTEDEQYMFLAQLNMVPFDRNNIVLPSGKVSHMTYYRRLKNLTAKLSST